MDISSKIRLVAAVLILTSQHGFAAQDVPSVSSPNYKEQPESATNVTKPEVTPSPEPRAPIPDNSTPDIQRTSDPQQIYQDLQDYVRSNCHKPAEAVLLPGPPGPPGFPGPTGPGGTPGIPGNHGNNGINGLMGRDGLPGEKGFRGEQGYPGIQGPPGIPGLTGDEGPRGPTGAHGIAGLPGPKGTMGHSGRPGNQGLPGKSGSGGPRGFKGEPGEPGSDGACTCDTPPPRRYTAAPGTSAFSVARTSGLVATDGPVIVTFQHVFVNVHDDFDINTGKFNCSIPGLYFFSINVYKSSTTNFPLVQILLNGAHQAAVIDYGSSDTEDSTSNSIILSLNLGDMVWLQLYDGRELYSSHYRFTTFSGFRIG